MLLITMFIFCLNHSRSIDEVIGTFTDFIKTISIILLIIGRSGVFKQVLVDCGVEKYIALLMEGKTIFAIVYLYHRYTVAYYVGFSDWCRAAYHYYQRYL